MSGFAIDWRELREFRLDLSDFRQCVGLSLLLHAAFFLLRFSLPSLPQPDIVEIDLTSPFIGTGPALRAAPKALIPGAKRPAQPVETPLPPEVKPVFEPPKEFVLPGANTEKILPPQVEQPQATQGGVVGGEGTSHLLGGRGQGDPYGDPNGRGDGGSPGNVVKPKLLNRDDVLKNIRKFYPERERVAGNEGLVVINIHVAADGSVAGSEIVGSLSPLFDQAADKIARLMKFLPARAPSGPVASKIRYKLEFKLED